MKTLTEELLKDETLEQVLKMAQCGLSKREIAEVLGKRLRGKEYGESGLRYAINRALAARAEELFGKGGNQQ